MGKVYEMVKAFKKRFPLTIAWRLKAHAKIIDTYINDDEEVRYVFTGQKGTSSMDIISTYIFVLTDKRALFATKRLLFGHFFTAVTPDMLNDINIKFGIIWGKIIIDTVKEEINISNLQKEALDEIETNLSRYMVTAKETQRKKRENR